MKLLVTGFAPFGGDTYNPSFEAAKRLTGEIDGCEIIVRELPVVFGAIREDEMVTASGSIREDEMVTASGSIREDEMVTVSGSIREDEMVTASGSIREDDLSTVSGSIREDDLSTVSGSIQESDQSKAVPAAFRYPPGSAPHALLSAIAETNPDAVLCVGVAGGRDAVTPEVIGINLMNARIPDNAGAQPLMEPIAPGGPDGLFSTLPVREMAEAIQQAGIPARLSFSAGSYVCNNVLYSLLLWIKEARPGMVGGFVHVPYAKEFLDPENKAPAMPLADITRALAICVRELL